MMKRMMTATKMVVMATVTANPKEAAAPNLKVRTAKTASNND